MRRFTRMFLILIAVQIYGGEALSREDNFNAGAAATAIPTGVSNANCNSALVLVCDSDPLGSVNLVSDGGNRREWETGKAAFPGSDTARETTVSWQSGRTNAIFSAPIEYIGQGPLLISVLASLLLARRYMREQRR